MNHPASVFLTFSIQEQSFAFPLSIVEKVIRAVAITPIPHVPAMISGFFNYHGTILPVYDLRKKLGLPDKPLSETDQFVLLRTGNNRLAIITDHVSGISAYTVEKKGISTVRYANDLEVSGIVRMDDGLLLILDPGKLLNTSDEKQLQQAINLAEQRKKT